MGLLVECPKCKRRNGIKAMAKAKAGNGAKIETCLRCGYALGKDSGRVYWVEWRPVKGGGKKRERIGPNKAAAEHREREVLSARAEGRYIQESPDSKTTFRELAQWCMSLPEMQAKQSYDRDERSLKLLLPFFGDKLSRDINPAMVEAYRCKRLAEPSGRSPKNLTKPATVNREIALFKTIFNKAVKNGKAERNPAQGIKMLKENNERDRILSPEEYTRLLAHCPDHLKPIVKLAYYTPMRQGEILNLTWGRVDLKEGFIQLSSGFTKDGGTKTGDGRYIPLNDELVEMFKERRAALGGIPSPDVKVFTYAGRSVGSINKAFKTAYEKAGIEDFKFHDLRHTAINNWRLQGHDYFRIMAASGHKTIHVFKRYNKVSKEELRTLVKEPAGSFGHLYGHQGNLALARQG